MRCYLYPSLSDTSSSATHGRDVRMDAALVSTKVRQVTVSTSSKLTGVDREDQVK